MRGTRARAGAAVVIVAVLTAAAIALPGGDEAPSSAEAGPVNTARVQRGRLSAVVSQTGTLTYRARPDGSSLSAINHARGTYTALPETGDTVGCGDVLYRVNDRPVLLLCGPLPAYRTLHLGDAGRDVRQLNRSLHVRDAGNAFTVRTRSALRALQRRRGVPATGALALGAAVVLPEAVRIATVAATPGEPATPGASVLSATSRALQVQVSFESAQQGQVRRGDRAQLRLPGAVTLTGRVVGFGRSARAPAGQGGSAADATIPTYISLDDPGRAGGLDRAPVDVQIATRGVDDALSVPVTALVGRSGGGFAVEVARAGAGRTLVAVTVGLFDAAAGRVQVTGALREGDPVVVPSL